MIWRLLIRIYTPFIAALVSVIHEVLIIFQYEGHILNYIGAITGHSILIDLYILATSRRFCKWYRYTVYLLLAQDIANFAYRRTFIGPEFYIFATGLFSCGALITFIIYRSGKGITNFLRY